MATSESVLSAMSPTVDLGSILPQLKHSTASRKPKGKCNPCDPTESGLLWKGAMRLLLDGKRLRGSVGTWNNSARP